ncbi:MAG TPA: hypothetical protein P5262_03665 [Candidatus Moranbacteria bacterium]|nr:hypothetical protein [Candidatus Moranbacteria bacterium]
MCGDQNKLPLLEDRKSSTVSIVTVVNCKAKYLQESEDERFIRILAEVLSCDGSHKHT